LGLKEVCFFPFSLWERCWGEGAELAARIANFSVVFAGDNSRVKVASPPQALTPTLSQRESELGCQFFNDVGLVLHGMIDFSAY